MFNFLKKQKVATVPAPPIPFGWKTSWFAFRTEPENVIDAIAKNSEQINWDDAINRLKDRKPFLTPQFEGWCLLHDTSENIERDLTSLFELVDCDVGYFEGHRGVGGAAYGWMKSGELIRIHSQVDGQLLEEYGPISAEEKALGIVPLDFNDDTDHSPEIEDAMWQHNPDEEKVLLIAGLVSVDPSTIDRYEPSLPYALKLRKWR